jgi:AhpD family alkylhydroperoxidase
MTRRLDYNQVAPNGVKALGGVYGYVMQTGLPAELVDLVYLRVSQINNCAYCLDMHTRDLIKKGVKIEKLALVQSWAEAGHLFSEREHAALAWAEAVIPALGAADPSVLVNFDDLPAKAVSYRFQFPALIFGVLLRRADPNECDALHDGLPAEDHLCHRSIESEKIDSDFAELIWIGHTRVFGIGTTLQISHGQQLQRAELGPSRHCDVRSALTNRRRAARPACPFSACQFRKLPALRNLARSSSFK